MLELGPGSITGTSGNMAVQQTYRDTCSITLRLISRCAVSEAGIHALLQSLSNNGPQFDGTEKFPLHFAGTRQETKEVIVHFALETLALIMNVGLTKGKISLILQLSSAINYTNQLRQIQFIILTIIEMQRLDKVYSFTRRPICWESRLKASKKGCNRFVSLIILIQHINVIIGLILSKSYIRKGKLYSINKPAAQAADADPS